MALPYFLTSFSDDPDPSPRPRGLDRAARIPDAAALSTLPDHELIARIRAGDDATYDLLFTTLYSQLREFAATYAGSVAIAEEAVQEVFLDLWIRRATWEPHGTIRAYLFRAVRNRASNALRHHRIATRLGERAALAGLGEAPASPDINVPNATLTAAVMDVIATLPTARRRAVLLRWRFGLSYAEIAQALGTSEASVTKHIARAREAVRPLMERYLAE